MLPIRDDNSDRTIFPIVNYLLLAINIFVFIYYQALGTDLHFTYSFATVPAEIMSGHDIVTKPIMLNDPLTGDHVCCRDLELLLYLFI